MDAEQACRRFVGTNGAVPFRTENNTDPRSNIPSLNNEPSITLSQPDLESSEPLVAYKSVIRFYKIFSKVFGTKVSYDWIPEHYFTFWLTYFLLISTYVNIAYTIVVYCIEGNYSSILKPLGIIGILTSVMK